MSISTNHAHVYIERKVHASMQASCKTTSEGGGCKSNETYRNLRNTNEALMRAKEMMWHYFSPVFSAISDAKSFSAMPVSTPILTSGVKVPWST